MPFHTSYSERTTAIYIIPSGQGMARWFTQSTGEYQRWTRDLKSCSEGGFFSKADPWAVVQYKGDESQCSERGAKVFSSQTSSTMNRRRAGCRGKGSQGRHATFPPWPASKASPRLAAEVGVWEGFPPPQQRLVMQAMWFNACREQRGRERENVPTCLTTLEPSPALRLGLTPLALLALRSLGWNYTSDSPGPLFASYTSQNFSASIMIRVSS